MYDDILIPTDGSAGANKALRHGIDLAKRYDATVHLVYIVDEDVYRHYGGIDAFEHAEEALEETGEELLSAASDRVEAASRPYECHLERTTPHEGIVDTAQRVGADLIVMGTEQQSDEYRRLIGSVSDRVLRTSYLPVHLVKADVVSDHPVEIRVASTSDAEVVRDVARRSLLASYGSLLDTAVIRDAIQHWYGDETFDARLADPNSELLVADQDGTVVGFAQYHVVHTPEGAIGEIHWIHVDPDHRGKGIGTILFERSREALSDRDVIQIKGLVLTEYGPGNEFYRAQNFEPVASRPVHVGGETYEQNVYVDEVIEGEEYEPQIEARTTADGETVYVNYDESEIGSEGPFFAAYRAPDRDERYGWFCSNCETFDNAMDTMGRIVCNQCGNLHKATRWDAVVTE